ncbi:phenol-soluble modulin PSM-alpha-1, partial [Xanthomonas citri pv. citri]|nr:phenol-soluble modulin PSM-alpha-1 [Xanthomonas citri pv. citri]
DGIIKVIKSLIEQFTGK